MLVLKYHFLWASFTTVIARDVTEVIFYNLRLAQHASRRPVSNSVQSWPSKISDQYEQMETPLNVSLILMGVGITENWTQSMLSFVLLVLVPLTSGKGWTWTCDPDTSYCRFLIFSLFWVSQKCLNTFHLNAKNHVDIRYEMSKPSQERVAHQWHSFAR